MPDQDQDDGRIKGTVDDGHTTQGDAGLGDTAAIKKDLSRDEEAHKRLDEQDERIARLERNLGLKE